MSNKNKIRILVISSIILLIALAYFLITIPNFYFISGLISMVVVIWFFYWLDNFFNMNYKLRHYIVLLILFTFGMAFSPIFYIWTPYDKVLHFFTPFLWCTLIFVPVNKIKINFYLKILITIALFLTYMMVHESVEYGMDKAYDLHYQGVYEGSLSVGFERQSMVEVQDPWNDTMQDEILDLLGAITFGIINIISYRFRRKEII